MVVGLSVEIVGVNVFNNVGEIVGLDTVLLTVFAVGTAVVILNIDIVGTSVGGIFVCFTGALENTAHDSGNIVGDDIGFNEGINVGLAVGALVGSAVGLTVGARVGSAVGLTVGDRVGSAVGLTVGFREGIDDGIRVGTLVNNVVGDCVGLVTGTIVGLVLGLLVGLVSGILVGRLTGILVGLVIGTRVTGLLGLKVGIDIESSVFINGLILVGIVVGFAIESSVLITGFLFIGLVGLKVGFAIESSVLITGFCFIGLVGLKVGFTIESSVLITGLLFIGLVGFKVGFAIESSDLITGLLFTVFGAFTGLVIGTDAVGAGELSLLESSDTGLLPVSSFDPGVVVLPFPEPLRFVGLRFMTFLTLLIVGLRFITVFFPLLHPVVSPPTFLFNQSLPLFTAFSAMCWVTLFTLFAMLSKILEQGLLFTTGGFPLTTFGLPFPSCFLVTGLVLPRFVTFDFPKVVFPVCLVITLRRGIFFFEPALFIIDGFIFLVKTPFFIFAPFLIILFAPLQKLLNPFLRHCNPFLIAICLAFAAAAFFNAATPPVFAIAATVNPTFTIFPILFNFLRIRIRLELPEETIYLFVLFFK
jgi:hypothetical protein